MLVSQDHSCKQRVRRYLEVANSWSRGPAIPLRLGERCNETGQTNLQGKLSRRTHCRLRAAHPRTQDGEVLLPRQQGLPLKKYSEAIVG